MSAVSAVPLAALERDFAALYSPIGRPSIPPEKLLWAMLLLAFYRGRRSCALRGPRISDGGSGDRANAGQGRPFWRRPACELAEDRGRRMETGMGRTLPR